MCIYIYIYVHIYVCIYIYYDTLHYIEKAEEAAESFRAALRADPGHVLAQRSLGFVLNSLGDITYYTIT